MHILFTELQHLYLKLELINTQILRKEIQKLFLGIVKLHP